MSNPLQHLSDGDKAVIDVLSVATMLGALVQSLPHIAATLTIIWTAMRIVEFAVDWTGKVKAWAAKRRTRG